MNKRFQKLAQRLKQGKVHLTASGGKWGGKQDGYGVGTDNGTSFVEQFDIYETSNTDSKRKGFVQCSYCTGFSGFDQCLHRRTLEALSKTTATKPSRKISHGKSWSTGSVVFFGAGKNKTADKAVGQEVGRRNESGNHLDPWARSVTRVPLDGTTLGGRSGSKEVQRLSCRCLRKKSERLVGGGGLEKELDVGCHRCQYEPDEKWQTEKVRSQQTITVAGVNFRMENSGTLAKTMGGEKFLNRLRGQFKILDPLSMLCTRPSHSTAGYLGDPQVRYRLHTAAKIKFDEMLICGVPGPYGPEFTIRVTLTPWHARAADEDIYGVLG